MKQQTGMKKIKVVKSNCLSSSLLIDFTLLVNRKAYPLTPTAASTGGGNSNFNLTNIG